MIGGPSPHTVLVGIQSCLSRRRSRVPNLFRGLTGSWMAVWPVVKLTSEASSAGSAAVTTVSHLRDPGDSIAGLVVC